MIRDKKYLNYFPFLLILVASLYADNYLLVNQASLVAQSQASQPVSSRQTRSSQELTELTTNQLIRFFDQTVKDNLVGAEDLVRVIKELHDHNVLINPVSEHVRDQSVVNLVKYNTFYGIVNKACKNNIAFDYARIQAWLEEKIRALEQNNRDRDRMHEETRELYRPMRFAEIPAGKYIDMITGEEFTVTKDDKIEIQETTVTQFQWASVMGENPSTYVETIGLSDIAEEVLINNNFVKNKKVKMRANAPVETVSYAQIQEFINKLNADAEKTGQDYVYALPSVIEYQALLQATLGQNWLDELKKMLTCCQMQEKQNEHANQTGNQKIHTCPVASGDYLDLRQVKKRVWDVIGNVWQRARDSVEINKCACDTLHYFRQTCDKNEVQTERIMFGGSYTTRGTPFDKTTLFAPVPFDSDGEEDIGFRLVRFPKSAALWSYATKKYDWDQFGWSKEAVDRNPRLRWDEIDHRIRFNGWYNMMEHPELYPQETQHTTGPCKKLPKI